MASLDCSKARASSVPEPRLMKITGWGNGERKVVLVVEEEEEEEEEEEGDV